MHRTRAAPKILGTIVFVIGVAVTPLVAWWAFAIDAIVAAAIVTLSRLPVRVVAARLAVVTPFLTFALIVPFVAGGHRVALGPLMLSEAGLWSAFNVVAKALLGATASIILAATTPLPDLIAGLGRLRVPAVIVSIIAFMFRYLDLLADGLARMRQAMVARAHDPRWLWQAKPIAQSAGTLFVRTYERGERIHLAMLARGFTGTMPQLAERHGGSTGDAVALIPGLVAVATAAVALLIA